MSSAAYEFLPLPTATRHASPVPVVPIRLPGIPATILALVDSGSLDTLLDADLADLLGVDLASCKRTSGLVANRHVDRYHAHVSLGIVVDDKGQDAHWWDCPVALCTNWGLDVPILGLSGLFRSFTVCIGPADVLTLRW